MTKKACSRRYQWNGFEFSSASEALCGALMVQYLPDFKIIQGETFQVPIGGGKTADFRFKNIIVEYHHPRLKPSKRHLGDFPSKQSYLKFKKELQSIRSADRREEFVDEIREELKEHYYERRRHAINDHPTHRNAELIVVSSPQEVFEKIISRFSKTSEMSVAEIENLASSILEMIHESGGSEIDGGEYLEK